MICWSVGNAHTSRRLAAVGAAGVCATRSCCVCLRKPLCRRRWPRPTDEIRQRRITFGGALVRVLREQHRHMR